jgi:RNA polymerase sigma factor (sigma-70 family)
MADATVFIVDDDASLRDATMLFLRVHGLQGRAFPSGEALLEAFRDDWLGCLLVDVKMEGMSGLAVQHALIDRGATMPIVIVTAFGDVPTARAALKAGAFDFLEKPVENEVLLDVVQHAIAAHRDRRLAAAEVRRRRQKLARLTLRERQVMDLVSAGRAHREIAEQLGISVRTVEVYKSRLMEKLQARTVADLVRLAAQDEPDGPPAP